MADTQKKSEVSYQQHGVEAYKQHGGSVISSDTMCSDTLCENDITGSSWTEEIHEQIFCQS